MGESKDNIELFNLRANEELFSPCVVVHGKLNSKSANNIQVQHPQLPPLTFPVNDGFFKATIILTPGANRLSFITDTNISKTVDCFYSPLDQNLPIHLCLVVAKDSPLQFDSPASQIQKEGGNGLDLAVKKMRIGARLMQAFTNEQMLRNGFGHRTIKFVEEYTWDTQFEQRIAMRNTIKVHIVRSDKTTNEIRDIDVAQQNPNAKRSGDLFGMAMDALRKYGGPFTQGEKPVMAACVFLDAHWDGKLIRGHAALGGGDDQFRLAIFGSHGMYSWPTSMEQVIPYFLDSTKVSTKEVANDANQCGTHWECLNVTLGAFMHEIGHSLGSPHQVNGVMLRDYITLNRSFLTKEAYSVRTNSYGAKSPIYPKEECTWHRLDLLRYLYHPTCTVPQDYYDPSFMRPGRIGNFDYPKPAVYNQGNGVFTFKSKTGIYAIEIVCGDLAKAYLEYLPLSLGGVGPQKEITISMEDLRSRIPPNDIPEHGNSFHIRILAVNTDDQYIENFPQMMKSETVNMSKFGFGDNVVAIKSPTLGRPERSEPTGIVPIDFRTVTSVRVYYSHAVNGLKFTCTDPIKTPAVPPRTYEKGDQKSFSNGSSRKTKTVIFGKEAGSYADITLQPNEIITGFNLKCGWWIDSIQFVMNTGRTTPSYGKGGGGLAELSPPSGQYIMGLYGSVGAWIDALGILYGSA
ncbi:putative zinc metalloproteinase [Nakaseomyces bracarensis]|uniref:Zinc metalloproteinase n=1 Tax=Nakaseomyces bracarensis TaxID=273131 RepID=A0ABR4NMZ5_9SACH